MVLRSSAPSKHAVATDYLENLARVLGLVASEPIDRAIDMLLDARATGRRVYIIGNGGSAATASHVVCDLIKTAHVKGHQPLRAYALTDNTPSVTAWANDTDYAQVFAGQLTALLDAGDVVIAISASGNSPNIIAGLRAATTRGARTIAIVGFDGGAARQLADVVVHIPYADYGLVEDTQLAIGHAFTAAIRAALAAEPVGEQGRAPSE